MHSCTPRHFTVTVDLFGFDRFITIDFVKLVFQIVSCVAPQLLVLKSYSNVRQHVNLRTLGFTFRLYISIMLELFSFTLSKF